MFKSFPIYLQYDSTDCGATCLAMIADYYGRKLGLDNIASLCEITNNGISMTAIKMAAEEIGLNSISMANTLDTLIKKKTLPCILHWNNNHFVVLFKITRSFFNKNEIIFHVIDPTFGYVKFNREEMEKHWTTKKRNNETVGFLMIFSPTPSFFNLENFSNQRKGIKLLFHYFKKFKFTFIKICLGVILLSLLQLIIPFLTQTIVDVGIGSRNIPLIYLILLAQFMLIFSRTIVKFIHGWLTLHMSVRINISLIANFIGKLAKLPMKFFEARKIGDILQRIDDYGKIEEFITTKCLQIAISVFTLITFSGVLFYYNLKIFLIFILGSTLYAIWIASFLRKRKLLNYKFFNRNVKNKSTTLQLITAMQEIKLQGCVDRKQAEWEVGQVELLHLHSNLLKVNQYSEVGNVLINESKNVVITVIAATSVISGDITLGMMLAIQYIIGQLVYPVEQIVYFILSLQEVGISMSRVNEILNKEDEVNENQKSALIFSKKNSIKIDNLSFKYNKSNINYTLKDISIVIPKGKITAIVGGSGSGKTTLIKILLGFYRPNNGTITVDSHNELGSINLDWWRQQCGVVMQDGYIFSDTIARNIAVGDEEIDLQRLEYASKMSNIYETIISLPLKYETMIGSEGQGLSQGQRQRLLIARAVYKNPEYIFFDEATNSLDAKNEKIIVDNLSSFFKGKTVIIIAHRLSTIKNSDQIIVLDQGETVEIGNHSSLLKRKGYYYNLVNNQIDITSFQ